MDDGVEPGEWPEVFEAEAVEDASEVVGPAGVFLPLGLVEHQGGGLAGEECGDEVGLGGSVG